MMYDLSVDMSEIFTVLEYFIGTTIVTLRLKSNKKMLKLKKLFLRRKNFVKKKGVPPTTGYALTQPNQKCDLSRFS
jgi:hypothetical protein